MRELERTPLHPTPEALRGAIVGAGRLGNALHEAMGAAGFDVQGPLSRGADGGAADYVLLCVPDGEIAAAAALIAPGKLVGHCSGATGLEPLGGHEAFSLHPLMTVTRAGAGFAGVGCAIEGSTARAQEFAAATAERLGMLPRRIQGEDRAAYHAAASMASNFLVTLEATAERLVETAGGDRGLLVPLVRATVENWAAQGPERALTGPIARGDEATVARQRAALADRTPDALPVWDALAGATRVLVESRRTEAAA
jgi:predicted short-subunit dehydrogenase-like oxidoreductase (DUF2520 family)